MKRVDIAQAVKDKEWQTFRVSLKGLSTAAKLRKLKEYKRTRTGPRAHVQVENYINALKRAGLI